MSDDYDGWLEAPYIVQLLANLGAQGKLPRRLGFVHPGDTPTEFDLLAEAVARQLILKLLIASRVVAALFVEPEHRIVWLDRADYWSGDCARASLTTGKLDLSAFRLDSDLLSATVYLNAHEVAAALGFRLIPPAEAPAVPDPPAAPLAVETLPAPAAVTPHPRRNYTNSDAKLVAEMRRLLTRKKKPAKNVTDAARLVVKMAQGAGTEDSKVKRLVARHRQIHPQGTAD